MKKDNSILEILLKYIGEDKNKPNKTIENSKHKTSCSNNMHQIEKAYNQFKLEPIRGLNF